MFIEAGERAVTLRQEGHVKLAVYSIQVHIALLTEGDRMFARFYKHCPPDGGRPSIRPRL